MKKIFLPLIISFFTVRGYAQESENIRIVNLSTSFKTNKTVNIKMDLVFDEDLKVESNRMLTVTPLIKDENYSKVFTTVAMYGRKREIINHRKNVMPTDDTVIMKRKNGTKQVYSYDTDIPYQKWMNKAEIILDKDMCGCGNHIEENSQIPVSKIAFNMPGKLVNVLPEPESVKRRYIKKRGKFEFPVNETIIYPDYTCNPKEFAELEKNIESVKNDEIFIITLHGYASPESPYSNNERLAKGRTEAIKQYIQEKYSFNTNVFKTESTPEDWEGFIELAENCILNDKDTILKIANSSVDLDEKEARIKKLSDYEFIRKEWLPKLRHTDYVIGYKVKPFTPEEARIMFTKDPTQLSLREMYDAAMLCPKGSDEYNDILTTAARLYSDNSAANINAAVMEIERGNLEDAQKLLDKADRNSKEVKQIQERLTFLIGK